MKFSNLPGSVVNQIMKFDSHPVADLVNQSVKFKVRKLRNDSLNNERVIKFSGTPTTACIKHLNVAYLTSYDKEYAEFYLTFSEDYFNNRRNGMTLFDGWWDFQ